MATDIKFVLSAQDNASSVFNKVKQSGSQMADGIDGAFSGVLSKFNLLSGAVGTMATIAAGGAFSKIIKETIAWTGEAVALSKSLGITTEAASILNVALGDVYLSKDTMLAGSQRIAKALKTEEEAFTKLGVATRDQEGHYRSTTSIMTDVNTKLGQLKEGTDRNVAGMTIYGKSWGELSGLIKLNNKVMEEAAAKAKELGLLVGDEQVKEMKKYKAALNDIEDVGKSLTVRFGNVLLPQLVKVGAFFGNNGPILAKAFQWSLNALGFTVNTVGELVGLMAFRLYSLGGIIKNVFTGNFAEAKNDYRAMVAAGEEFSAKVKSRWNEDWTKDKPITSKEISGDHFDNNKEVAAVKDNSAQILKEYQERAKKIITIEEARIKELLEKEKGYLDAFKKEYEENILQLDKFSAAMKDINKSRSDRFKATADAARGAEEPLSKMARLNSELLATENDLNSSWADPAAKVKGLDDLVGKYREIFKEIKDGEAVIYSQEAADRDFRIAEDRLQDSISAVADEMKLKEKATVELAEKIDGLQLKINSFNKELQGLDFLLKGLDRVVNIDVNMKLTGMDDVTKAYQFAANAGGGYNMGGSAYTSYGAQTSRSSSDYYQVGDSMYWGDGTYAGPALAKGTSYVPRDGVAYLHKGEAVIPAAQNNGLSGNVTLSFGDIIVQGGSTGAATARDIARNIWPELQKLSGRALARG